MYCSLPPDWGFHVPCIMILSCHLRCHDTAFSKNKAWWVLLSVVFVTYFHNHEKINNYNKLHTVPLGLSILPMSKWEGEFLCLYIVPVSGVSKEASISPSLKSSPVSTSFSKERHLTSPQGPPFLVHLCSLMVINTFYLMTFSSILCAFNSFSNP